MLQLVSTKFLINLPKIGSINGHNNLVLSQTNALVDLIVTKQLLNQLQEDKIESHNALTR